ncbi:MAG: hypothetical protein GY754_30855 [bacterium]|nr:hypothetical protein [bacterium]
MSVGPSDYSLYIKINVTNDDIKILKNKKYMGNETSSIFYPLEIAKLFLKKNEYNNFDAIKYVTIKGRMVNIQSFAKSPYTGNSGVLINNQLLMWLRTM